MFAFPNMQLVDFMGPYDFFMAAPGVEVNIIGRSRDAFLTGAGMTNVAPPALVERYGTTSTAVYDLRKRLLKAAIERRV